MTDLYFIPQPQRCTPLAAAAAVGPESPVVLCAPAQDGRLVRAARSLFSHVEVRTGPFCLCTPDAPALAAPSHAQGYRLQIEGGALMLCAGDAAGLFYGMQTLRQWLDMPRRPSLAVEDWPDVPLRADYLDLRGIFPKFDRLLAFIAEMAQYKLNALVIEYEDKLPRADAALCAKNALTPAQHRRLLETARENFIEIIPLQQTFGHLEYVLGLPQYRHLREVDAAPGELCPLRPGAQELARALLADTLRLHPDSRFVHIGCDEVWSLGQSPECRASGKPRGRIAVDFVNAAARAVLDAGKTPLVWHDMIASPTQTDEALAALDRRLVVAVWLYGADTVGRDAPVIARRLDALGIRWAPCSAVRAFDERPGQNYPDAEQRLRNIDAWAAFAAAHGAWAAINTNWASSFSRGCPYGLFETSRYTAFYAAERCWNLRADAAGFLERFFGAYHGAYGLALYGGPERRYDYYREAGAQLAHITRNRETAQLIGISRRLERAGAVETTLFRGDLFPTDGVELDCLRERTGQDGAARQKALRELAALLPRLLDENAAALYLASRTWPGDVFAREAARILGAQRG